MLPGGLRGLCRGGRECVQLGLGRGSIRRMGETLPGLSPFVFKRAYIYIHMYIYVLEFQFVLMLECSHARTRL